ncbi:MAG TPA: hypothetical protein VFS00_16955 [Polyangiaceae bacterium]|nr:hypothetical protein [Polyangiaceae bacterium]
MADQDFPEELRRFVAAHLDTVDQLEVLLLLQRRPAEVWTPQRVSDELRTSPMSAAMRLERLCATGLCEEIEGGGVRLRPADASVERAIQLVTAAYREKRVSLIALIYARPPEGVRAFADAFRLKKDK